MKKALTRKPKELYFYKDGVKKIVDWKDKTTYPNNIYGNISPDLYGKISSALSGGISSALSGNISGISGEISSALSGNLDDCEITEEERKAGVNVEDLIED